MARNSHQDALDQSEFQALVEGTDGLAPPNDAEALLILVCAGRLGMRAGEIAHMTEEWLNREKQQIRVPFHDPCDKGRHGGPCGYCRKRARSAARHDEGLTFEDALAERWEPKTPHSARTIPYSFDGFTATVVENYFDEYDRYGKSRVSVNRRVTEVAEHAGLNPETVYPHCLRATAASYNAYAGVPAAALQSMFGWSDLSIANKYIRLSGGATDDALQEAHADD